MTEYRYAHEGGCRCGALRIHYACNRSLEELAPRACQCEFCLPRNFSYISAPEGRLEVRVRDRRMLYAHVFGTGTAEFMHCAICNHAVYVRSEIEGRTYGLVVAQALCTAALPEIAKPVDYDEESLEQRLSRRADNWIPELELIEDA